MTQPLESLHISGFRSIEDLKLELPSEVTLLVGANGSGKSNIIAALELLGRIVDGSFQEELLRLGGFASQLHRSPRGLDASSMWLEVWGVPKKTLQNGYRVDVQPASGDAALLDERTYFWNSAEHDSPYENSLGAGRESRLSDARDVPSVNRFTYEVLTGCRVFHFDDTSIDAPPLRRVSVVNSKSLLSDGSNVAAVLLQMKRKDPARYARLRGVIQSVAPFFDDFELEGNEETTILNWREKGLDGVFPGSALSSGTLRFICLATLLMQPDPPATIVLDEPELGLHPFAIHQLAALLHEAAKGRRVIAATQSVTLLGQFTVDEIAIVERSGGVTTVTRPDRDQLEDWLVVACSPSRAPALPRA